MTQNNQIPVWWQTGELTELEQDEGRKQHVASLLNSSEQPTAPKSLENPKSNHIPEYIFIKPLHANPTRHLEQLSVFLIFRTRFSALPLYQQNLYTWGVQITPLDDMFGMEFLKDSCDACGIGFEKLQLLVDELWRAGVFLSSSDLMRSLRDYTGEDLGSHRFRKAVGLQPLRRNIASGDEGKLLGLVDQNRVSELLRTREHQDQKLPEINRSSAVATQPKELPHNTGSEVAPSGDCTLPPTKSRFMTMISSTSLYGGNKNIYNPSLLRHPMTSPVPSKDSGNSLCPQHDSRPRSISISEGESTTRNDNTNRRHSTSNILRDDTWDSFCRSQARRKSSGVSAAGSQRPENSHGVLSAAASDTGSMDMDIPGLNRRASTSILPTQNPVESTSSTYKLGSGTESMSSNRPATVDNPLSTIGSDHSDYSDHSNAEDAMEIGTPSSSYRK